MFKDTYFYNESIKNSIIVFGSLFDNIHILRKDDDGSSINQIRVPIAFAPKMKIIKRLEDTKSLEEDRKLAIKLPRMSFEITSFDRANNNTKTQYAYQKAVGADGEVSKMYSPIDYNLSFELSIYVKTHEDAYQIIEQIIPFFDQTYQVQYRPLKSFPDYTDDMRITLDGVSHSDDYESSVETRRTIIYTLSFRLVTKLYKPTKDAGKIIKHAEVNINEVENMKDIPQDENNLYKYKYSIIHIPETEDPFEFDENEEEWYK